jgi:hypothetical protein
VVATEELGATDLVHSHMSTALSNSTYLHMCESWYSTALCTNLFKRNGTFGGNAYSKEFAGKRPLRAHLQDSLA